MDLLSLLFQKGIATYTTTIYTPIPANPAQSFQIGKDMPLQIGRIFGMAIYTDGLTPDQADLVTSTDAFNLYINLKVGSANFVEEHRLSDMISFVAGVPITTRSNPFMEVNIPDGLDLSTSKYLNPTGIVAGANNKTIALKLWYIGYETYNQLLKDNNVASFGEWGNRMSMKK